MTKAQCSCGAISLALPGPSSLVVACHCIECQRRTGSPFGVGVYDAADAVTISGTATEYVRAGKGGGKFRSYFCANCGSSVYWTADKLPAMIGVAVGAIADPDFRAPDRSVFEQSKHHWVEIDAAAAHFPVRQRFKPGGVRSSLIGLRRPFFDDPEAGRKFAIAQHGR